MSQEGLNLKKAIPIITATWILSLITTLVVVYVSPGIFPTQIPTKITANDIAPGAVITTKLADGAVTSEKILDATITAEDLATDSILTVKIADDAITTEKIADNSITTAKIADSAIVTVKLANDTVTGSKIVDGAIVTVKLADSSVTSAKILNGTIVAGDLANGSVTSIKIADGAVTTEKIVDLAVTTEKIADGSITATKLTPQTLPFSVMSSKTLAIHSASTNWEDMGGTSTGITLNRTSSLLIMFSTEARVDGPNDSIAIRALVDSTPAAPDSTNIYFASSEDWTSHSYIFYKGYVVAGHYAVTIEWRMMFGLTTGRVADRALTVIAFPR